MKSSQKATVIQALIDEFTARNCPDLSKDQAFLLFTAMQILKPRDIPVNLLEDGITDGSKDGGIDAMYTFLNNTLLTEDSPYLDKTATAFKELSKHPKLDVLIMQTKCSPHWEESAWHILTSNLPRILDPEIDEADLVNVLNSRVIEKSRVYRKATTELAVKFPDVHVQIIYAACADNDNISPSIEASRARVESMLRQELLHEADLTVRHVGIEDLYDLSSRSYSHTSKLTFEEIIRTEGNAFLGLATIQHYLEFLSDDEGLLTAELFDGNVRDFEGKNQVNTSIERTLSKSNDTAFWWQNNGITILAKEATCPTKTMTLDSPLVVNGLQTSYVLFESNRKGIITADRLHEFIVVRVIATLDDEVRDSIIAGTNRQTKIPQEALYASGGDQIDIERYFLAKGWYYERRRKHYRNQNAPSTKRIEISYLAQAVMTLALGQPDMARARPSTLLTKENGYEKVFPKAREGATYLTAARIMKEVDAFLKTNEAKQIYDDSTNSRFYVALCYYMLRLKIKDREKLKFDENAHRVSFPLDTELLLQSLIIVRDAFECILQSEPEIPRDTISKRSTFRDSICDSVRRLILQH